MKVRRFTSSAVAMAMLALPLLNGGCGTMGGAITAMPTDWSAYNGRTVTVRGNAGNLRQGPIVRFDDGGYVALLVREPWSVDVVGRPVEVVGRIVSGQDFRAEKWAIEVQSTTRLPQSAPPPPTDAKGAS